MYRQIKKNSATIDSNRELMAKTTDVMKQLRGMDAFQSAGRKAKTVVTMAAAAKATSSQPAAAEPQPESETVG